MKTNKNSVRNVVGNCKKNCIKKGHDLVVIPLNSETSGIINRAKNSRLIKSAVIAVVLVLIMLFTTAPVFAYDGTGNGNSDYNDHNNGNEIPDRHCLAVLNNPSTVEPIGQTPSGYVETGNYVSITSGTAEGWRFIGWNINGHALASQANITAFGESTSLNFTMPDESLTVTANWEAVETLPSEPSPEPTPTPDPTPDPPPLPPTEPTGRLLLIKRAQGTNQLLSGAVFEIRRSIDDALITTQTTNHFGEISIDLPIGDFFLREITAPYGFINNPVRHPFRITNGNITSMTVFNAPISEPTPTPSPTPSPPGGTGQGNNEQGRLIITLREHGTNELLTGAVFELRRAMDNAFVAQLTTNQFGEASINLPAGDFFLREIIPARNFTPNQERRTVRINADRITEINLTSVPLSLPEAPRQPLEQGRLLITKRDSQTNAVLQGAVFEVRRTMDDVLVGQIATNQFGEAVINLLPGDFYLRQIIPPVGHVPNTERRNFTITEGQLLPITILSRAIDEPVNEEMGRLLVTVLSAGTGQRIPNAVVTLHNIMTDVQIGEMTTDQFGEASLFIEPGNYFIRQRNLPSGYIINHERIPVTIRSGDMTDIMIVARPQPAPSPTPTPAPRPPGGQTPTQPPIAAVPPGNIVEELEILGRLEIITRAEGSGNRLSGGLFAVYRQGENERVAEITTGAGGLAAIELEPGQYFIRELRSTFGFLLEDSRILVDVAESRVTQINLTKQRDWSIAYLDPDIYGGGFIYITQTGQMMSILHYGGGGLLLAVSLGSGALLLLGQSSKGKRSKQGNQKMSTKK